jgi:hypothetical protein
MHIVSVRALTIILTLTYLRTQELLNHEISHFLLCAARWTIRWFNKPKFHIFVHLPEHIRRFGPAILFATEAFESFNAIIRAKSVHSNRHAPSRDIALAFAQSNRVRHLLSGGHFNTQSFHASDKPGLTTTVPSIGPSAATSQVRTAFSHEGSDWKCAGSGPRGLVHVPNTVTRYLGLDDKKAVKQGEVFYPLIGHFLILFVRCLYHRRKTTTLI